MLILARLLQAVCGLSHFLVFLINLILPTIKLNNVPFFMCMTGMPKPVLYSTIGRKYRCMHVDGHKEASFSFWVKLKWFQKQSQSIKLSWVGGRGWGGLAPDSFSYCVLRYALVIGPLMSTLLKLQWSCMYNCLLTAVNCGRLTDPANGRISHNTGTTLQQTATYSCNTGYDLVGDRTRTCQDTGLWSGSEPTCHRMSLLPYMHAYMHIVGVSI